MTSLSTDQLINLRNEIHKNVPQVYANKIQCERLCERIDQLIDPLERLEHTSSSILREETRSILDKLLQCIDDCNNYIEKLKSPEQWYEEIYEYKKSEETLKELNKRLSQLGQDLCLGLNIQQLFDQKQDHEDQKEDLKDLQKKLDQISQKMLEKQCEQYKLIDKMIDKRFQSFRFYLAQNLLMQLDSNQSQELIQEHQQILHIPYKDLYIEDKLLGNGGFADVYKGTWLTHHDQVAIKIIRIHHLASIRSDFYRETSTMYRIRYDNVLSVLGACVEPNFYAIITEYMPLGSLYDILHKKREQISFDWSDRYSLAWQMAKSINYLHNLNPVILHRDIKSMNFLLKHNGSPNQKYLVKVCDFGLAEIRRETSIQSVSFPSCQIIGSFYWKAPELFISHTQHTKQSDVYSLGIVFWELATERIPWDEYADDSIILVQVKTGQRPTIPSDIPEQYKQLIQNAWNHDPQKRPTCFQLMERSSKEINLPTVPINEQEVVDLHPSQKIDEQHQSVTSMAKTDSTRIAIQVTDEENQEQILTESIPHVTISEASQSEPSTDDGPDPTQTGANQVVTESILEQNVSSLPVHEIEQQDPVLPPLTSSIEQASSKSTEDLTSYSTQSYQPVAQYPFASYKIEKRRPLHSKDIWAKKDKQN